MTWRLDGGDDLLPSGRWRREAGELRFSDGNTVRRLGVDVRHGEVRVAVDGGAAYSSSSFSSSLPLPILLLFSLGWRQNRGIFPQGLRVSRVAAEGGSYRRLARV
jgi:hypothetical protein